jgi:hypothetical protein
MAVRERMVLFLDELLVIQGTTSQHRREESRVNTKWLQKNIPKEK